MDYPITYTAPLGGTYQINALEESAVCDACDFPATHRVTVHYPDTGTRTETLCALHTDDYRIATDLSGTEGMVGTVQHWHGDTTMPVRVVLALSPGRDRRWHAEVCYAGQWESLNVGWKRSFAAILQAIIIHGHHPLTETTDPLLTSLLDTEVALREKRLREAEEKDRREREEAEAYRVAQTAFWDGVDARLKGLKGKREDIAITLIAPDGTSSQGTVKATRYGPLALTKEGSLHTVTHLGTGLLVGKGFPTQRQAKETILLLLESEIDWETLTATNITPEQRKVSTALQQAVRHHGLPEFIKLSDVPLDK